MNEDERYYDTIGRALEAGFGRPMDDPDSLRNTAIELCKRIDTLRDALRDLYERVEMDESDGTACLSDRVPSLRAGEALRETELEAG